jgi:hypothetical protein
VSPVSGALGAGALTSTLRTQGRVPARAMARPPPGQDFTDRDCSVMPSRRPAAGSAPSPLSAPCEPPWRGGRYQRGRRRPGRRRAVAPARRPPEAEGQHRRWSGRCWRPSSLVTRIPSRHALLGITVRQDQGRVGIDDQQLDIGVAAGRPPASAGRCAGGTQTRQPVGILGGPFDDPRGGRGRGDPAEQLGLIPNRGPGLVACTRKLPSLASGCDLRQAAFFQLRGHLHAQTRETSTFQRQTEASYSKAARNRATISRSSAVVWASSSAVCWVVAASSVV